MSILIPSRPASLGDPAARPKMRGWLHTYAAVIAGVCGIGLSIAAATRPGSAPFIACLVYVVTICAMFGTSALYHRHVWGPRGYVVMKRCDHAMIFLFIAGTYTPFCVLLLSTTAATRLLVVVWAAALAGAVLKICWPRAPRWFAVPLYLALGWVAVFVLPAITQQGGIAVLVLLVVGGLLYSLGSVFYALRWPNPWPRYFGHHEFFHAATIVAALCHHVAIYLALFY